MTRQPHDQFAKQYLEELLTPFGTVVLIVTTEGLLLLYKLYSILSLYTCAYPCAIEPVQGLIYSNFNVFTGFQTAI
ncbi:hypothetical protein [Phormidium nigroviride]